MRYLFFLLILLTACQSDDPIARGLAKERQAIRGTETFGKSLEKKYNILFLGESSGYLFGTHKSVYGLSFINEEKMTQNEARQWIIPIIQEYWKELNENPVYLEDLVENKHIIVGEPVIDLEKLGIQIAYWDENVDRPLYPYVARVQVSQGQIRYYYADPETQALQDPIIEQLEDVVDLP